MKLYREVDKKTNITAKEYIKPDRGVTYKLSDFERRFNLEPHDLPTEEEIIPILNVLINNHSWEDSLHHRIDLIKSTAKAITNLLKGDTKEGEL